MNNLTTILGGAGWLVFTLLLSGLALQPAPIDDLGEAPLVAASCASDCAPARS